MAEARNNIQRRGGAGLEKLGLFEAAPVPHRRQVGNMSTAAPTTNPAPMTDPAPLSVTTQLVTVNQSVLATTTQSFWSNSTVTLTLPCSSCPGGVTTVTTCVSSSATPAPAPAPATTSTLWQSGNVTVTQPCPVCTQLSPQPTQPIVFISSNCTWTQPAPAMSTHKHHHPVRPVITTSTASSAVWVSKGTVTVTSTLPCSTTMPAPWTSVSNIVSTVVVTQPAPAVITQVPIQRLSTVTLAPSTVVVAPTQAAPSAQPQQPVTPQPQPQPTTTAATTSAPAAVKTGGAASFGVSAASGLLFGLSGAAFALL
ncbi:hypothetical protein PG988_007185 [Apiospora saccharicola]